MSVGVLLPCKVAFDARDGRGDSSTLWVLLVRILVIAGPLDLRLICWCFLHHCWAFGLDNVVISRLSLLCLNRLS